MRSSRQLLVMGLFLFSVAPALSAQTVEIKSLDNLSLRKCSSWVTATFTTTTVSITM